MLILFKKMKNYFLEIQNLNIFFLLPDVILMSISTNQDSCIILPWSVVLDNGVKSIKLDLRLANISIKHHTGMLKLITPQNLTWQVGGSHLQTKAYKITIFMLRQEAFKPSLVCLSSKKIKIVNETSTDCSQDVVQWSKNS